MKNKLIIGLTAVILLSAAVLFIWYFYFSEINVSIVSLEAPKEIGINEIGYLKINLQNNAPGDVNVTVDVKNAFVNEKGESLKTSQVIMYELYEKNIPLDTVLLKPGINNITVQLGYQVLGVQKIEVNVYQNGKLADSRSIEVNVPKPKFEVILGYDKRVEGPYEIHQVYGWLSSSGKGYPTVAVNISVINEITNTTVSTVSNSFYSLRSFERVAMVVWIGSRNSSYNPVTGVTTYYQTEAVAPIAIIELSKGEPSTENYILSPAVVKGKMGERYKVVVTARWRDQVVSSELSIPSQ